MTPRKFYDTVKAMREAQRRTESSEGWDVSKETLAEERRTLEGIIDAEIERVEKILARKEESREKIRKAVNMFREKGISLEPVNEKNVKDGK